MNDTSYITMNISDVIEAYTALHNYNAERLLEFKKARLHSLVGSQYKIGYTWYGSTTYGIIDESFAENHWYDYTYKFHGDNNSIDDQLYADGWRILSSNEDFKPTIETLKHAPSETINLSIADFKKIQKYFKKKPS